MVSYRKEEQMRKEPVFGADFDRVRPRLKKDRKYLLNLKNEEREEGFNLNELGENVLAEDLIVLPISSLQKNEN